jgi:predicted cobalt transporter CbtA
VKKRPLSVTIIGWLLLFTGVAALAYHLTGIKAQQLFQSDLVWMYLVELTAIVCGIFMLRGRNWARWLAVAWLALHVVLSSFHSVQETLVHGALLGVLVYFLFRRESAEYFASTGIGAE